MQPSCPLPCRRDATAKREEGEEANTGGSLDFDSLPPQVCCFGLCFLPILPAHPARGGAHSLDARLFQCADLELLPSAVCCRLP